MTSEFFEIIKARVEPHLAKQATNYRAPLSVGMKLAITLGLLKKSCTSMSYQFMVGRSSVSKFVPNVCRAIYEEFGSGGVPLIQMIGRSWNKNLGTEGMYLILWHP